MRRSSMLLIATLLTLAGSVCGAVAQDWPTRPIRALLMLLAFGARLRFGGKPTITTPVIEP